MTTGILPPPPDDEDDRRQALSCTYAFGIVLGVALLVVTLVELAVRR